MNVKRALISGYRAVGANPRMQWLNKFLLECALRGMGIHNYETPKLTGERHLHGTVVPRLLRENAAFWVVDVGANVGEVSAFLRGQLPEHRLLAIEPHPNNFAQLSERLGNEATLLNCAVGSRDAKLELYDYDESMGSSHASLYREVFTDIHKATPQPTPISVRTLDEICQQQRVNQIGFLKIDTEGHELEVLKGCSRLLAEDRIHSIQIEFNAMNVVSRVFVRDILNQLPGFSAYRLLPRGLTRLPKDSCRQELFGFQNLWLVRDREAASQPVPRRHAA